MRPGFPTTVSMFLILLRCICWMFMIPIEWKQLKPHDSLLWSMSSSVSLRALHVLPLLLSPSNLTLLFSSWCFHQTKFSKRIAILSLLFMWFQTALSNHIFRESNENRAGKLCNPQLPQVQKKLDKTFNDANHPFTSRVMNIIKK